MGKKGLSVFILGRKAVSRFSFPSFPLFLLIGHKGELEKRHLFREGKTVAPPTEAGMAWHCSVTFGREREMEKSGHENIYTKYRYDYLGFTVLLYSTLGGIPPRAMPCMQGGPSGKRGKIWGGGSSAPPPPKPKRVSSRRPAHRRPKRK